MKPKIHEIITEETWCKEVLDKGNAHCMSGWVLEIYPEDFRNIYRKIRNVNKAIDLTNITCWNDVPERTFQEVLDVFKKADV